MFNFKKIAQELSQRTLRKVSDDFNKNVRELMNFLKRKEDLFDMVSSFISYNGLLHNYSYTSYYYLEDDYNKINNFIQTIFSEYDYLQNDEDKVQNYLTNLTSLLEEAKEVEQTIKSKIKNNLSNLYNNFQNVFEQTMQEYFEVYMEKKLAESYLLLFKFSNIPILEDSFKQSIIGYLEEYMLTGKVPHIYVNFDYIKLVEDEFNRILVDLHKNDKSADYEDFDINKFYTMLLVNLVKLIE